jgi:hypothetical protein
MLKTIAGLAVLALLFVYGAGAVRLSEGGAHRFLNDLETLSLQGDSDAYCERLHRDLAVSIRDHTAPGMPRDFDGGKKEFCDYVAMAAKGMALIGPETSVTREEFTVTRSWLHPWTAQVSYHETRTTHMTKVNVTLDTEGEDRWVLVNTLDGVKALRLDSETRLAD